MLALIKKNKNPIEPFPNKSRSSGIKHSSKNPHKDRSARNDESISTSTTSSNTSSHSQNNNINRNHHTGSKTNNYTEEAAMNINGSINNNHNEISNLHSRIALLEMENLNLLMQLKEHDAKQESECENNNIDTSNRSENTYEIPELHSQIAELEKENLNLLLRTEILEKENQVLRDSNRRLVAEKKGLIVLMEQNDWTKEVQRNERNIKLGLKNFKRKSSSESEGEDLDFDDNVENDDDGDSGCSGEDETESHDDDGIIKTVGKYTPKIQQKTIPQPKEQKMQQTDITCPQTQNVMKELDDLSDLFTHDIPKHLLEDELDSFLQRKYGSCVSNGSSISIEESKRTSSQLARKDTNESNASNASNGSKQNRQHPLLKYTHHSHNSIFGKDITSGIISPNNSKTSITSLSQLRTNLPIQSANPHIELPPSSPVVNSNAYVDKRRRRCSGDGVDESVETATTEEQRGIAYGRGISEGSSTASTLGRRHSARILMNQSGQDHPLRKMAQHHQPQNLALLNRRNSHDSVNSFTGQVSTAYLPTSTDSQPQIYFDGFRVRRRSSAFSSDSAESFVLDVTNGSTAPISFGLGKRKQNRYRSSIGSLGGISASSHSSSEKSVDNAAGNDGSGIGNESVDVFNRSRSSFYSLASCSREDILREQEECSSSGSSTSCSSSLGDIVDLEEGNDATNKGNRRKESEHGHSRAGNGGEDQAQCDVQARKPQQRQEDGHPIQRHNQPLDQQQKETQQHHLHPPLPQQDQEDRVQNLLNSNLWQEQEIIPTPSDEATEAEIESFIERRYGQRISDFYFGGVSADSSERSGNGSKNHAGKNSTDPAVAPSAVQVATETTGSQGKSTTALATHGNSVITSKKDNDSGPAQKFGITDRRSSCSEGGRRGSEIYYDGFRVKRRSSTLLEDNDRPDYNRRRSSDVRSSDGGNSFTVQVPTVGDGNCTSEVFYDGSRVRRRSSLVCEEEGGTQPQKVLQQHQWSQHQMHKKQDENHRQKEQQNLHRHQQLPQDLGHPHHQLPPRPPSQTLQLKPHRPRRRASVDSRPDELDCVTEKLDKLHFTLGDQNRFNAHRGNLNRSFTAMRAPTETLKPLPQFGQKQSFSASCSETTYLHTEECDPYQEADNVPVQSEGDKTVGRFDDLEVITSKHPLKSSQQWNNGKIGHATFRQFFLLTKIHQPSTSIDILDIEQVDAGKRFLDPFIFKNADVTDNFPQELPKTALDPVELSTFCVPEGIKIRLIPKALIAGANKIGWLDQIFDYKVLAFTDGNGATTHGIAIKVSEEVSIQSEGIGEFAKAIKFQRSKRAAARRIRRWWQRILESRRDSFAADCKLGGHRGSWSALSTIMKASRRLSMSSRSFFGDEDEQSVDSTFDLGKMFQESFNSSTRNFARSSKTRRLQGSLSTLQFSDSEGEDEDEEENGDSSDGQSDGGFLDWSGNTHYSGNSAQNPGESSSSTTSRSRRFERHGSIMSQRSAMKNSRGRMYTSKRVSFDDSVAEKRLSDEAMRLGREAYKAMEEADDMGDVLIIEKCYVVLGGKQSQQFLHFRILQNMIHKEQDERRKSLIEEEQKDKQRVHMPTLKIQAVLKLVGLDHKENVEKRIIDFRHRYLRALQTSPMRSYSHGDLGSEPKDAEKNNIDDMPALEIELPTLSAKTTRIIVPPSLPHVAIHWGVSALFARIKSNDLILILKLLLIERSVLVVGESSDLVTACACALLELLAPYDWASNFMPLLPTNMIGFLSSPVPFLIGMVVDSKQDTINLEHDCHVVQAMEEGLSVINLSTRSVRFTTEPEILSTIEGCPTPTTCVCTMQKKLKTLFKNSPAMKSFPNFIASGFSREEICAVDGIRRVIYRYLKNLAGNISKNPFGWKMYGKYNEGMDTFDFYPSLFVDDLRKQLQLLTFRLEYLEMMAYSQLFVEYVDVQRRSSLEKCAAKRKIGTWVVNQWKRRRSTMVSSSEETQKGGTASSSGLLRDF